VDRAELLTQLDPARAVRPDDRRRIFAICNHKGGVGKTTTSAALGWFFAQIAPTLLIDADPQAHLTQVHGLDSDKLERTLYEVLVQGLPIQEAIQPVPGEESEVDGSPSLYIVGSNLELAGTTLQLSGRPWWVTTLRNALRPVLGQYRFVIVDCPPTLDTLTLNALAAATDVIIPVDMGAFSLRGTVTLRDMIRHVAEQMDVPPKDRFLACRLESNQLSEQILDELWTHYGEKMFRTVIRKAVDVGRAQWYRQPLPVMFPNNPATHDYAALAREILEDVSS
jgi:chromosome partitioning protein